MDKKKLGFGLMRLPLTDSADTKTIDKTRLDNLVDRFMGEGFSYFDTAAPYHGGRSEEAFGESVAARHPRSSFTITDKLSFSIVKEAGQLEDFFKGQLERCRVDYFDYYLLHALNKDLAELAERIGAFEFIRRKKEEGLIRHIGFSFHDSPEVLDRLLSEHPEIEYVQLQLNYVDWENPEVQSRRCHEVAVRHGKRILVMEPVKGGLLANVPPEAEEVFKKAAPDMSVASWGIRFAASLENVDFVLSGMSDEAQLEDNISYMSSFTPLSDEEMEVVNEASGIITSRQGVACTACRYCVDGCPAKIAIPEYFRLLNDLSMFGDGYMQRAKARYSQLTVDQGKGKASACLKCGKCEKQCPQRLPIRRHLEKVAEIFG